MKDYIILSSGPTEIDPEVSKALQWNPTNPDIDPCFFEYYKDVISKYNKLIGAENSVTIAPSAEAMLVLEASLKSLVLPDEKVLVISNGIFGKGFKDLVEHAGGEAALIEFDIDRGIKPDELDKKISHISNIEDIKLATIVHCETPTGVTNDVFALNKVLEKYNILSIVDSVSAVGGEEMKFDESGIGMLLMGSQKCLSLPPLLSLVTISKKMEKLLRERRKTGLIRRSFYMDILSYVTAHEKGVFKYTYSPQMIKALSVSLEQLSSKYSIDEHKRFAKMTRDKLEELSFELYAKDSQSNTLSSFVSDTKKDGKDVLEYLKDEYNIIISGSLAHLKDKVYRIGHMGANLDEDSFNILFTALEEFKKG